jgi:hypothetical protein
MTRLRAPKVTVTAVPVFTSGELSELAKACQNRSFAARRDAAIIAVFTATGIRLSELAGIRCHPGPPARGDLDLNAREIKIRGKGRTASAELPSGAPNAADCERYRNCVGSGHAGSPIAPFCMRGWLHRNPYRAGSGRLVALGAPSRPSPLGRARRLDEGRRIRSYARRLASPSR